MKKLIACIFIASLFAGCKKEQATPKQPAPPPTITYTEKDIYYYSYTNIDGLTKVHLSSYKGKKILFVNTATYCTNTPQYEKLQNLYTTYASRLVIIGFPCNQFNQQEPGENSEIKDFCSNTYGITFPMSQKIDVKGTWQAPVYSWLTKESLNGKQDSEVAWNFQKYLVDEKGTFISMFPDYMQPDDPAIIQAIEQ